MLRLEIPQSQSSELVAAVFWCHTVAPDDTQYRLRSWTAILDQEEILNQSPRLEPEDPGNRLEPVDVITCGSDHGNQLSQQQFKETTV